MAKKKSNETKVLCPNCGTELAIPAQSSIAVGVIIGKDAGLGLYMLLLLTSKSVAHRNVSRHCELLGLT